MYYYCTDHISTLLKINAFEVNAVFVRHLDMYITLINLCRNSSFFRE